MHPEKQAGGFFCFVGTTWEYLHLQLKHWRCRLVDLQIHALLKCVFEKGTESPGVNDRPRGSQIGHCCMLHKGINQSSENIF